MNERKTITLGVILESARMIAPVLDIGGRHEGARVINQLCAAVERLAVALQRGFQFHYVAVEARILCLKGFDIPVG